MLNPIANKTEFEEKVKRSTGFLVLIFHGDNSSVSRINRYREIALDTANEQGKVIEVYTINLDNVVLDNDDQAIYQCNNQVICCVTKKDCVVQQKRVNPTEVEFMRMVLDLIA